MPRDPIPFATGDVSALAKSLRAQWASRASPPSHVEMLNMLARAAGHRNFQQFRARGDRRPPALPQPPVDADTEADTGAVTGAVLRAARFFDPEGRLRRWPAQRSIQDLCLWAIWARIPAGRRFDEREVSALLATLHLFGDPAADDVPYRADDADARRARVSPHRGAAIARGCGADPASARPGALIPLV